MAERDEMKIEMEQDGDGSVQFGHVSGGTVIINTGNAQQCATPRPLDYDAFNARSARLSRAKEAAPPKLMERDKELALLAEISTKQSGYHLFEADAYSGKSSLLAWFFMHHPEEVITIGYFIFRYVGEQSDSDSFVRSLSKQLALLVGEELPDGKNNDFYIEKYEELLDRAIEFSSRENKKLVFIIDGIDEDMSISREKRSIVSLLPRQSNDNLTIILAKRPNPPLPSEPFLGRTHPVRKSKVYALSRIKIVGELERRTFAELETIHSGGETKRSIASHLAVAGGYLTITDISALTGIEPFEIRTLFESPDGRVFISANLVANPLEKQTQEGYRFAHAKIQETVLNSISEERREKCLDNFDVWCDKYNQKGWKENAPYYLLTDYIRQLRDEFKWDRLVRLLTNEKYITLVLRKLWFYTLHMECFVESQSRLCSARKADLFNIASLQIQHGRLHYPARAIPMTLPAVIAKLGDKETALIMAENNGFCHTRTNAQCTARIALAYAETGDFTNAVEVANIFFATYAYADKDSCQETLMALKALIISGEKKRVEDIVAGLCRKSNSENYNATITNSIHLQAQSGFFSNIRAELNALPLDSQTRVMALLRCAEVKIIAGQTESAKTYFKEAIYYLADYYTLFLNYVFKVGTAINPTVDITYTDKTSEDDFVEPLIRFSNDCGFGLSDDRLREILVMGKGGTAYDKVDIRNLESYDPEKCTSTYDIAELYKAIAIGKYLVGQEKKALKILDIVHTYYLSREHTDKRNYGDLAVLEALLGDVQRGIRTLIEAPYYGDKQGSDRDYKSLAFSEMVLMLWKQERKEEAKIAFDEGMRSEYEWSMKDGKHCGRGRWYYSHFAGLATLFYDFEYSLRFFDASFDHDEPQMLLSGLADSSFKAGKKDEAEAVVKYLFEFIAQHTPQGRLEAANVFIALLVSGYHDLAKKFLPLIEDKMQEKYQVYYEIAIQINKGSFDAAIKLLEQIEQSRKTMSSWVVVEEMHLRRLLSFCEERAKNVDDSVIREKLVFACKNINARHQDHYSSHKNSDYHKEITDDEIAEITGEYWVKIENLKFLVTQMKSFPKNQKIPDAIKTLCNKILSHYDCYLSISECLDMDNEFALKTLLDSLPEMLKTNYWGYYVELIALYDKEALRKLAEHTLVVLSDK